MLVCSELCTTESRPGRGGGLGPHLVRTRVRWALSHVSKQTEPNEETDFGTFQQCESTLIKLFKIVLELVKFCKDTGLFVELKAGLPVLLGGGWRSLLSLFP